MRQSRDPYQVQAQQLCVSVATIAKWKHRAIPADRSTEAAVPHARHRSISRRPTGRRVRNLSCSEHRTAWMFDADRFRELPNPVRPAVTFSPPMRLQTQHEGTGHSGEFFFFALPSCKNSLDQATPLRQFNYEKAGSAVTVSRLTEVLCLSLYAPMETSTDLQKRD